MVDDLFGGAGPAAETPKTTPGPWRADGSAKAGTFGIFAAGGLGFPVATVWDTPMAPCQASANAHLIAAAPCLLAALEAADEASRLRSWAMGADDYRANEKAHQAQIEAVRLRNEALIKAGVRTEARPPAGVENE